MIKKLSGNLSYWNLVLATNLHKKVHIMSFLVPTLYMGCRPGGIISKLVGTKNSNSIWDFLVKIIIDFLLNFLKMIETNPYCPYIFRRACIKKF